MITVALLALSLASSALAQQLSAQMTSLLLLRGAIDGNGALSSWNPTTDMCTAWEGVTCDGAGMVTGINLQDKGLQGQIPLDEALWTNLSTLQNFNVANNALTGFVPPQMSVLKDLEYLSVGSNQLESVLPASWEALTKVKGVDMSGNKLYGDLPAEWSNLASLQALDLSENNLSGAIPASWSQLSALEAASLAGNAQLCTDNPNAGADPSVPVYYGPCDATSPQLPDINPDYPPVPAPTPAPAPSPPAPTPSPAPSPAPLPVPPPPPSDRPDTYVELKMTVEGGDKAGAFWETSEYRKIIGKAAKVLPAWVEVTGASSSSETVTPATSGRKLLAEVTATELSNKVYTRDQDDSMNSLNEAIDSGSLADDLQRELGVILVPGSASVSKPSSTNVGAIVGGVVGGVCGLIIIVLIFWFVMKKKRDGGPIGSARTGEKRGAAMYSSNAAFEESAAAEQGLNTSQKEEFTMYEGAAYDMNEPTPRSGRSKQEARTAAAVAQGVNPLAIGGLERKDSGLSDPDSARYQTPSVASSAPMTARSRLESARSEGLQSNPLGFNTPREVFDGSSDEEGNNPLYAKSTARSGASTAYGSARTAGTGLDIDSSRKYESANESGFNTARTHASMTSNPLGGVDEEEDAQASARSSGSTNPLFRMLGKK